MIDLTPLDVRNKRGDFKKGMRGYDPQEVDVFLELVAERLEALVRENIQLRDRTKSLQEQVDAQVGREKAVQDALVTAQELREDMREQSQREADHVMREAESEAKRMIAEAEAEVRSRLRGVERQMDQARSSLQELERRRHRFLQDFRALLQRELDNVEVEEGRTPLEERAIDLELGSKDRRPGEAAVGPPEPSPSIDAGSSTEKTTASDAGSSAASAGSGSPAGSDSATGSESFVEPESLAEPAPAAEVDESTVDVADLKPGAPEPDVDDPPSSLELELMAGAVDEGGPTRTDVPDLETVLAEAGIDGAEPDDGADPPRGEEISPPPADHDAEGRSPEDRRPEDRLAFFDKDKKEEGR